MHQDAHATPDRDRLTESSADTLVGIVEACRILGVTHTTLYARLARGQVPLPVRRAPIRWRVDDLMTCAAPRRGRPRKEVKTNG